MKKRKISSLIPPSLPGNLHLASPLYLACCSLFTGFQLGRYARTTFVKVAEKLKGGHE